MAVYMRDGASLIELQPVVHGVFEQICAAVGVHHHAATDAAHSHLYEGDDRRFITLRPAALAGFARLIWRSASPSDASLKPYT